MFKNILLPIDIEDKKGWKSSFNVGLDFLKANSEAKLTVMTVVPNYGMGIFEEYFPKGWVKEIAQKTNNKLIEITKSFIHDESRITTLVKRGTVYQTIIDEAELIEADLIIMSAHHPERSDYLLGPNVARVVRHANTSVLVVRE